jgi:hypothetical protein
MAHTGAKLTGHNSLKPKLVGLSVTVIALYLTEAS